jgi:hypothetical protein
MIRGPISLLIVGSLTLVLFLLVSLGPRAFEGYLPESIVEALETGIATSIGGERVPQGATPADLLDDGPDGLEARGPIAALAGNQPVFIKDVITGYTKRVGSDIPAEITTIRPISGCRLTPPMDGTIVGHATAAPTGLGLALMTYDDAALAAAVQDFVNTYRDTQTIRQFTGSDYAYEAYDVAVTETKAPVYLVLETGSGNRIWNIHLAEGARIERVVLLGGDQTGIANLDPVVPIEVISAQGLADCGIAPAYPLNAGHRFFQVLNGPAGSLKSDAEAKLVVMQEKIAAYDTWFRDSFGVRAQDTRAGFSGGTLSVVGPVPGDDESKAIYAPIKGSRIRMTQGTYIEIKGQVDDAKSFSGRVEAIATSFAFGNLANLRQGVGF